jgi:hypothetical protein
VPPSWLESIAMVSLVSAFVCAAVILVDIFGAGYRQRMGVMEWVWPITALYLGVFGLAFYWFVGRRKSPKYEAARGEQHFPFWVRVGVSASHCGGGCTLGDIIAETLIFALGISLFGATIWASFVLDYAFALALGIAFQFAAIHAMTRLPFRTTVARAAKADVLSLTAFEVGLFTWMALMFWVFFPDPHLEPNQALYWFLMQVGMAIGYLTSYPMNILLIRKGIKEAM